MIAKSGGSRTNLYSWFGNKEGLFAAVVAALCEDVLENFRRASRADESPEETLEKIGVDLVKVILSEKVIALYRLVVGESARFPNVAGVFYDSGPAEAYKIISNLLQRWKDEDRVAVDDPEITARLLVEMMVGDLQLLALCKQEPRPSEAQVRNQVRVATSIVLRGLSNER